MAEYTDTNNTGKNKSAQVKENNVKKPKKENTLNEKEPINWKRELLSWILIIIVAFICAELITNYVIMKAEIISTSMVPGLLKDDHVLGNRLAYTFSGPDRGDVIFFEYPKSNKSLMIKDCSSKVYVKRVIGLPGETVEIKDGLIYINGSDTPLEEPYLNNKPKKDNWGPYTVPEDCYFVLGDNRNVSMDARYWDNTVDDEKSEDYDPDKYRFVNIDAIYAKAWLKYIPFPLQIVDHAEYSYDYEG